MGPLRESQGGLSDHNGLRRRGNDCFRVSLHLKGNTVKLPMKDSTLNEANAHCLSKDNFSSLKDKTLGPNISCIHQFNYSNLDRTQFETPSFKDLIVEVVLS